MESKTQTDEKIVYEGIRIVARIFAQAMANAVVEADPSRVERNRKLDGTSGTTPSAGERQESLTLTVPQAAKLLGISRGLAYELASSGRIPCIHLGHRYIIPRGALIKLLGEAANRGTNDDQAG